MSDQNTLYYSKVGLAGTMNFRSTMDSTTGQLYMSKDKAVESGVNPENLVEIVGSVTAIMNVSNSVKEGRKKNKLFRKSQKKNRRK